jgi:hypothetical protein
MVVVNVTHVVVEVAGSIEKIDESARKNSNGSEQLHRNATQNLPAY